MGQTGQSFAQIRGRVGLLAQIPGQARSQHGLRFATLLLAALLLLGWGSAPFDWDQDARWELQSQGVHYRLDQTLSELGVAEDAQEMVILGNGLLVRQQSHRAVNLTVLKGEWTVWRDGQLIGEVGTALSVWQAQIGVPLKIYRHSDKAGVIYYYRASLVDLGLMVADSTVQSVMFVEPGYLEQALQRSGYHSDP